MTIEAILLPMFAQVALTFGLLFWMTILRLRVLTSEMRNDVPRATPTASMPK